MESFQNDNGVSHNTIKEDVCTKLSDIESNLKDTISILQNAHKKNIKNKPLKKALANIVKVNNMECLND